MELNVNGKVHQLDVEPEMPLLWVLRDELGMSGTKFGCGLAQCGACTVHVDGSPVRSCVMPVGSVSGPVTTIEGLPTQGQTGMSQQSSESEPGQVLHVLQHAWIEMQVAQCGYCQSGQLMSAAALLANNPVPLDEQIDEAMSGNLCRCGTYPRIRAAVHRAAQALKGA